MPHLGTKCLKLIATLCLQARMNIGQIGLFWSALQLKYRAGETFLPFPFCKKTEIARIRLPCGHNTPYKNVFFKLSIPDLPKETHVFQINTCSWGSRTIWRKVGTLQPCAGLNDTVQGSQELGFSSTCFKVCADLHRKLWRKGARSRYDIQI